jgi:hypothetical protein
MHRRDRRRRAPSHRSDRRGRLSIHVEFRDNAAPMKPPESPMSMRALCGALLACLLATGCATMEPRVQRASNKLDYDRVAVLGENRAQEIRWKLVGEPNAEFTSDGVSFRNSAFDCRPEGKQAFVCRDTHPGFGVFKYTVNVTLKESPFGPRGIQSLDRWVANR